MKRCFMARQVRRYTKEFREEAVKLALKSDLLTKTANELGIPVGTLSTWIRQLKGKSLVNSISNIDPTQNIELLLEENRRLHKELSIVKEEKEILKKAAAYFAQHQK
jgi:transposase